MDLRKEYDAQRQRGAAAVRDARLGVALDSFEQAESLAQRLKDPVLIDRARCNRYAVAIELGQAEGAVPALAAILMRKKDGENSRLAAYHLARLYQARKEIPRALFYARQAEELARDSQRPEWIAMSHNQLGMLLVADSRFEPALERLETALAHAPGPSVQRGIILDNIGYCRLLLGRSREGFRALFASLRLLNRLGERFYEIGPRLSLCFGYLDLGRYHRAFRHGQVALRFAEQAEDPENLKASLFLLGEAAKLTGRDLVARRYFSRLQESFFPKDTYLTDLLMLIDARQMINLKA